MQKDRSGMLLDVVEIKDLASRFAEAATLGDLHAFRKLWKDDALWTIGHPPQVSANGADEIVNTLAKLREGKEFFVQFAYPGTISFTENEAQMTCLYHEEARGPGAKFYRNHCISRDQIVFKEGRWVFASRKYYYIWLDQGKFDGESFPDFAQHPF